MPGRARGGKSLGRRRRRRRRQAVLIVRRINSTANQDGSHTHTHWRLLAS